MYQFFKDLLLAVRSVIWRPSLKVLYDVERTKDKARAADANMRPACFYHLLVRNEGPVAAKDCRGYIDSLYGTLPGTGTTELLRKPEQLKWANEPTFDGIDIEPNSERRLDLVYLFEDERLFRFFIKPTPIPVGTQSVFAPGDYRLRVRVASNNARTSLVELAIHGDGRWDTLTLTILTN